MTSISTTAESRPTLPIPAAGRNGRRAYAALLVALAATGAVFSPAGSGLRRVLAGLHPHAPDLHLFLIQPTVIQVHLLAALAALGLGAVMMKTRKGARFHRTAGWVWVSLMALVAGSSLFIVGLNGDKWSLIHLLSGFTLMSLPLAVFAARRHDVKRHRRAMMGLFLGGLVVAGLFACVPGRLMWNLVLG